MFILPTATLKMATPIAIVSLMGDEESQLVIEDGGYTLTYSFDGRQEQASVRVADGRLLSGN